MTTFNIHEKIDAGQEVIGLYRNGKPIETENDPLKMHLCLYKGAKILYDPTDHLTQDEWPDQD